MVLVFLPLVSWRVRHRETCAKREISSSSRWANWGHVVGRATGPLAAGAAHSNRDFQRRVGTLRRCVVDMA